MQQPDSAPMTDFGASINGQIVALLRRGAPVSEVLQFSCEALSRDFGASGCVVWSVVGDRLQCTQEYRGEENPGKFLATTVSSQESMNLVLQFLSIYPDEKGSGLIAGTPLIDLGGAGGIVDQLCKEFDVQSTLNAQLRSRGIFLGFIQLQQSGERREWTEDESKELLDVSQLLSAFVQMDFDNQKIAADAWDLKLLYDLSRMFGPFDEHALLEKWTTTSTLVADRLGFGGACVYLDSDLSGALAADGKSLKLTGRSDAGAELVLPTNITFSDEDNPIIEVFQSQRVKILTSSGAITLAEEALFKTYDTLLLPLKDEDRCVGVMALWKRLPGRGLPTPQMREFALIVSQHLAEFAVMESSQNL